MNKYNLLLIRFLSKLHLNYIIIIFPQLYLSYSKQIDQVLCQQELMNIFQSQQIDFECINYEIVIQNYQHLKMDINLESLTIRSSISIRNIGILEINNLSLNDIVLNHNDLLANSDYFISIINVTSINIDTVSLTNMNKTSIKQINIIQTNEIDNLAIQQYNSSDYLLFQNVKSNSNIQLNSKNITIYSLNILNNINYQFYINASQNIQVQKVYFYSEYVGFTDTLFNYVQIFFESNNTIRINKVDIVEYCKMNDKMQLNYNIVFNLRQNDYSATQVLIDQITYNSFKSNTTYINVYEFFFNGNWINTNQDKKFQTNNKDYIKNTTLDITQIDILNQSEQNDQFSIFTISSKNVTEVNINSFNIQSNQHFGNNLVIQESKKVSINELHKYSINSQNITYSDLIVMEHIENLIILSLKVNKQIVQGNILSLKEVKIIKINEIEINKSILKNQLIKINNTQILQLFNITCQNVVITNTLLTLTNIEYIQIEQFSFLKNQNQLLEQQQKYSKKYKKAQQKLNQSIQQTKYLNDQQEEFVTDITQFQDINNNKYRNTQQQKQQQSNPIQQLIQIYNITSLMIKHSYINLIGEMSFMLLRQYEILVILDTQIENGYSSNNGGCIDLLGFDGISKKKQELYLYNSTFNNCKSKLFGGGIYGGNLMESSGTKFSNCSSSIGGAIYALLGSNIQELNKITYQNNDCVLIDNDMSLGINNAKISQVYEYNPNLEGTELYLRKLDSSDFLISFNKGIMYVLQLELYIGVNLINTSLNTTYFGNMYKYIQTKGNFIDRTVSDLKFPYITLYRQENSRMADEVFTQKIQFQIGQGFFANIQGVQKRICDSGMEIIYIQSSQDVLCKYCDLTKSLYYDYEKNILDDQIISDLQFPKCQSCSLEYFTTCYANFSSLKQGYWRSSYSIQDQDIEVCSISPQNCQGGSSIGNELCHEGHIGAQCLDCDIYGIYWNQSYSRTGQFSCNKCSLIQHNEAKVILYLLILLLSVLIIIKSNFKYLQNKIYVLYLSRLGIMYIGKSLQKKALASVYLKILLFNTFIYSVSNSLTKLDILYSIKEFSLSMSKPLDSPYFSQDCFLVKVLPDDVNIGFTNLLLSVIMPTLIITFIALLLGFLIYLKKIEIRQSGYILFLSFIYVFMILFYSNIIDLCLKSFVCIGLEYEKYYNLLDLSVQCSQTNEINKFQSFSIPIFVFILVLIPLIVLISLFLRRHRLNKIRVMFTFGFLYKEYKQKFYYWEFIRFLVKIWIVTINISLKEFNQIIGGILTLLLVIYLIALQQFSPFNMKSLNDLEKISVLISLLNAQTSLMFNKFKLERQEYTIVFVQIVYITFQILNLIFILYLVFLIFISVFEQKLKYIQQCLRFTCFDRFFPQYSKRLFINMKRFRIVVHEITKRKKCQFRQSIEMEMEKYAETSHILSDSI